MQDEKLDRRVQRTRKLLKGALVSLTKEKGYNNISIQDITDHANLGRTTFYLHYQSKEDLLLDHHAEMSEHFNLLIFDRQALFADAPQTEMVKFLELLSHNRPMYHAIRVAKESAMLLRGIRGQMTANVQNSLNAIFPNVEPLLPTDVLTEYVIGAQLSLINWWMSNRTPYKPEQLAMMLHRMLKAAIFDAYPTQ